MLYRWTPGGWGYYRKLNGRAKKGSCELGKLHSVREKHSGDSGWSEKTDPSGNFTYRDYATYQEYLDHQKVKFDEMIEAGLGFDPKSVGDMRTRFFRRFRCLPYHLSSDAAIVCAGARQGTEVEVLQDMGFSNVYGTDLNPGPDNPWVRKGDFMKMEEATDSVDLVFCNAIDHVLDIDMFLAEQARVIRPGGYAMFEFMENTKGGAFEAVEWASDGALLRKLLEYFEDVAHAEKEAHWRWFLVKGPLPRKEENQYREAS
tara:strand:- start:5512 stop:6288 length:777 start_codon:yes stop_codon:yes gene_type:complete